MTQTVNLLMGLLAVSALIIGAMIFALGPDGTARTFAALFASVGFQGAYSGGLQDSNTDSEMRFFSVFWFGFGLWILSKLRERSDDRRWVLIALALFWAGGWARVLSILQTGAWPDPLFQGLLLIECVAPMIVAALHIASRPVLEILP